MSEFQKDRVRTLLQNSIVKGLVTLMSLWLGNYGLEGRDISAYAKPKEDYNYIYTLDHEYETTLFRSEQFEPLVETEKGFVILLQLGGKPKLVLLPFDNGDRKVAEKKHRGVGVTYTAFLSFTEGYLPFFSTRYYEVVKREKGMLSIDYQFKGFRKTVEVPESGFIVKSAFEYHLDESLKATRRGYHTYKIFPESPETWPRIKAVSGPGVLTESPTHIGIVRNKILATNYQSIRTSPASDLLGIVDEVRIDSQKLFVAPILYTHETAGHVYYFLRVRGYDRPVLIKDFAVPEGSQGHTKVVRISSNSGPDARLLEISETTHLEFYPSFHFLSPGQLATVREGFAAHYLIALDGEYEISPDNMDLLNPGNFMQLWAGKTRANQLHPGDPLYEGLLKLQIPAVAKTNPEWQDIQKLQAVADLNKKCVPEENAPVQRLLSLLNLLEEGAERLQLTLLRNPKHTNLPVQNQSYLYYWGKAFDTVNAQAARERNQKLLNRQILRAKVLISETDNQALIDFLSSQIYTYSNYLPAPLNRINELNTSPPLAASRLLTFNFPLDKAFKIQPDTLEPIKFSLLTPLASNRLFLLEKYNPAWQLDTSILDFWQAGIISRMEEVQDPEYWRRVAEIQAAEKKRRLEIARKRLVAAQAAGIREEGFLNSKEAPWVAAAIWLVVILMTNTGFFALAKAMPVKDPS